MNGITLTLGHIARHTPHGAGGQGRDAAIVDIAQDLLLRHLHGIGVLDALAFKGGTALRKLYAGNAGRFSLDLDFSSTQIGADPDDALTNLIVAVDGLKVGPFSYGVTERRGKWTLTYEHDFGGPAFNPEKWLRDRSTGEFDEQDIGALAVPVPTAAELSEALRTRFRFLADLDDDERLLAHAREQDRPLALRALAALPGARLAGAGLY